MLVKYVKDIDDEPKLNIGQTYVVLLVYIYSDGDITYGIKASLENCWISTFSANCFEIVSSKIPDCWNFIKNKYGIELLPKEWDVDSFLLRFSDSDPEIYDMAEEYIKKITLDELPMEEFERAFRPNSCNNSGYIDILDYTLEMITEARDDRFIKHVLEVAQWFRLYTFNLVNKYTYKQEVEVLEKVYIYLSLFKNNYEIKELFEDFINKNDTKFPKVLEIISEYFQ